MSEVEPWEGGKPWVKGPPSKAQRLALLAMVGDRAGHIPLKPKVARDAIYRGLVGRGLFNPVTAQITAQGVAVADAAPEKRGKYSHGGIWR